MDYINQSTGGKVIRVPSTKRSRQDTPLIHERVKLERVLGLTVFCNAALDCDPITGTIAYPAGCTVILYNPRKNRQSHLVNASKKTITSLGYSVDGRYVVSGECGHLPSVRVWDTQERAQVAEFPGHKYGINCVAFSPNHKYVVSVGSQHDMIVNVWDWRNNIKVASNKISSKVKAISFAENGSYFVTVGNRHVKFWYLEYSRSSKYKEPVPLMGRSAILGEQRNNYFCDVSCGRGEMGDSTYAITKSGLLCEFNNRRLLDKWVELRTTSANCLVVGEEYIFIGCAEGIVRCFSPWTLQFVTTLPRTHYMGVDVAKGLTISHMASHPSSAKYPDTVAVTYDSQNHKVTCIYNDRSMYVWDVRDIKRVGKSHSFLYHSACIWGLETYPVLGEGIKAVLPPGSFITCSSDDTIRIWNLDPNMPTNTVYKRNIYSADLLKTLYIDPDMTYLKDIDYSPGGSQERTDTSYDGRNGVRAIRISPDGKHLASGDRAGNVRIHELQFMDEMCKIEAHDAEVLCLEYTKLDMGHRLLASASRDRLIHIFNCDKEYSFVQTLDDHSSSITAVKFILSQGQFQMVSCGADKSIIFRLAQYNNQNHMQFSRGHNVSGKTTLYDMDVDINQKHLLTACQDRNIRVYNVSSGKHSKTFKGSIGEDGTLIKLVFDSTGIYIATSSTDKTLCIYDYYSGECMATMSGHSELVTGLRFTNDCKHLISVAGDGCIFVWKIPHEMTVTMQARMAQQAARAVKEARRTTYSIPWASSVANNKLDNENFGPVPVELYDPNANSMEQNDYRFSVGQLPFWAKKQIQESVSPPQSLGKGTDFPKPKGRWAQRVDTTGITMKSVYENDSLISFPVQEKTRLMSGDSDGSKDSSIDSEYKQSADVRRETVIISKQDAGEQADFLPCSESILEIERGGSPFQLSGGKVNLKRGTEIGSDSNRTRTLTDDSSVGSFRLWSNTDLEGTEHDGDVEDYSEPEDAELTEPEHPERLMYYPQTEETGSEYTVNAMDVEELRRSQRRHKKAKPERPTDIPMVTVSGSQESDDDDDEVSTPSADTAERNLLSLLSVSSESLDRVGQREKFLKSNYESLSGAENEDESLKNENSISAQFLTRTQSSPLRNVAVINAARHTKKVAETSKKREELQRRIDETRRKLQSIGYKSNLQSSQSITDLSNIPEKDTGPSHSRVPRESESGTGGGGGGLRRACSLSDLSKPSPRRMLPSPPVNVSGKSPKYAQNRTQSRPSSRQQQHLMRSTSTGVLNQSDSDGDSGSVHKAPSISVLSRANMSSAMRPTISSQNKVNQGAKSKGNGRPSSGTRRRSLSAAVSAGDLRRAVNEDSSSEEASPTETSPGNQRMRSISMERSGASKNPTTFNNIPRRSNLASNHAKSERDLTKAAKDVTQRLTQGNNVTMVTKTKHETFLKRSTMTTTTKKMVVNGKGGQGSGQTNSSQQQLEWSPEDYPVKDTPVRDQSHALSTLENVGTCDIASAPINKQLCDNTSEALQLASDNIVQLYKRISMDVDLPEGDRTEMLQKLSSCVAQAQQTLRPVHSGSESTNLAAFTSGKPGAVSSFGLPVGGGPSNLADLLGKRDGGPVPSADQVGNPLMVQMMQQCSDMLLTMVQQRMAPTMGPPPYPPPPPPQGPS